jgi:hypothetical protein
MANLTIDREARQVKILLDTRFYGYGAVMEAGRDFGENCWVLVDGDKDDKLLISLKPKKAEISLDTLGYEFCNYVLGLMQNAIF